MQERPVNGNMTFKDYQIVQSVAGYAARWDIAKENVLPKASVVQVDQGRKEWPRKGQELLGGKAKGGKGKVRGKDGGKEPSLKQASGNPVKQQLQTKEERRLRGGEDVGGEEGIMTSAIIPMHELSAIGYQVKWNAGRCSVRTPGRKRRRGTSGRRMSDDHQERRLEGYPEA